MTAARAFLRRSRRHRFSASGASDATGRGRPFALVPPNAFQGMSGLPPEIDRAAFEERIYAWYPTAGAHPWFVITEMGMITARALVENLIATVERDGHARPEVLGQLRERIEAVLGEHAERLGCAAENVKARLAFERCAAGKPGAQWLKTYRGLNRFRTSLPSVKVHDFMEQHRRQEWEMGEYEADLAMLLKRAVDLRWNEKLGMLTIKGIGKYRRVHASEFFSDDDCGLILETKNFPSLLLYQDGETTPVSDLMGRENHIFGVVPKVDVEAELSWRLPVFEGASTLSPSTTRRCCFWNSGGGRKASSSYRQCGLGGDDLACFFSEFDGNPTR